jgi:hypothetical protein
VSAQAQCRHGFGRIAAHDAPLSACEIASSPWLAESERSRLYKSACPRLEHCQGALGLRLHATMPFLPAVLALRDILPSVLGPPLAVYALARFVPPAPLLPLWLTLPLCVFAVPALFVAQVAWRRASAARAAKRRGARLMPWVADDWLGRGVIRTGANNFANGYLGACDRRVGGIRLLMFL